jgi:hypothetical protein
MPVCDGCGTRADEAHILSRNERIELALRYRPTQIKVLILDGAPPARLEDTFYQATRDRSVRSVSSRVYFDELVKASGATVSPALVEDSALVDFRKKGFFLAHAVECPTDNDGDLQATMRRFAPTVLKRVQYTLQPNYIVPIGVATAELIRLFGMIGWGDRLVLDKAGPFVDPYLNDPKKQATFNSGFGSRISKALEGLV